jgi:putative transport protein
MMRAFAETLRAHPELAIFLTLALGFLFGKLKIGSFRLGNVVGTLLAGVLVGQTQVQVPGMVKTVFFDLFLFAVGYKIGPQFFRGLKKDALSQVALTFVLCTTSLLTAFAAAKLLGYDIGTTAGLVAGAFTESTVIGTAADAINRLSLSAAEKEALINAIPVAYAVTYLLGTIGVIWFLPTVGPKLMGVNLKEEAKKLQTKLGGGADSEPGVQSAYRAWDLRAYRVTGGPTTVSGFEESFTGERVFVQRIRRSGAFVEVTPATAIRSGDEIAVMGRRRVLLAGATPIGVEIEDKELQDIPAEILDVVVTKKGLVGVTLTEVAKLHGRGVALASLTRGGQEMPISEDFALNRGDVLRIFGAQTDVERAAKALGYIERPSSATDMIFVGTGIVVGGLVGLLSVSVGGLPLTLTASGGALVGGLVFGWLRSVYPVFGRIPEPAIWVFDTVGLAVFIGVVGLTAGPTFLAGVQKTGLSLVFVGAFVALIPHIVAILFGRYVLKMNPLILLGACSGAGTMTAALRAVQDEAQSKYPALGYTVPYAVGNFLLTAWGPVIVMLMTLWG